MEHAAHGLDPIMAFAFVGLLGVGAQVVAWRLRMPAIVLMLAAGLIAGPVTGFFDPARDIGPLTEAMISIAVAIILFEGGLTLNIKSLQDAAKGVMRLVVIGAPLGWLLSTLALHYVAGLSWESATIFGGIMIVTGPTVIGPLLRSARLSRRPSQILQWEAIVNDPIGALAAVLAYEVVAATRTNESAWHAFTDLAIGIGVATALGVAVGLGMTWAFRKGRVPEYMKVPVIFTLVLATFAGADYVLHESGLLAVTVMGIVIANVGLASFEEIRRFKEHATILLVSGVFILLAAGLDLGQTDLTNWQTWLFVAVVILIVRPATVLIALAFSGLPKRERTLIALTGPRGVVLVAVAGLFGERLVALGVADGARIGPLAFVLVATTVVLHGFSLRPMARAMKLTGSETPGLLIVGGSRFSIGLAEALEKLDIPVLLADPNHGKLRGARRQGLPTFYGDLLSEAAEHKLDLVSYTTLLAATDNDAYNTMVATELAMQFGRDKVWQVTRHKDQNERHALPASLGGQGFARGMPHHELEQRMRDGWYMRTSRLTEEYDLDNWYEDNPDSILIAARRTGDDLRLLNTAENLRGADGMHLIHLAPPETEAEARVHSAEAEANVPDEDGEGPSGS